MRSGNKTRTFFVDGGFAEISWQSVTVLTEACEGVDDIDIEHARQLLKDAERDISTLHTNATESAQEDVLDHHYKVLKRAQTRLLIGGDKNVSN